MLKRSLGGTYISVEPFHLFRYIDEQAFRFNNRNDMDDLGRFELAARNIAGKRLTYAALTTRGTGSATSLISGKGAVNVSTNSCWLSLPYESPVF
jgi:hypothetical protein